MTEQCRYRPTERPGLYVMVFLAMIFSCNNENKLQNIERSQIETNQKLSILESKLKPNIVRENVLFGEQDEAFYEINGQRAYIEIDGKPISEFYEEQQK